MTEYFAVLTWSNVGIPFGILVTGMVIGICLGFNAGRQLAIERITDYVNSKTRN